jgi:hypothetical protein
MSSGSVRHGAAVTAVLDALDSAFESATKLQFDALTVADKLSVLDRFEQIARRIPAVEHTLIAGLNASSPIEIGATSWREALSIRLSISRSEARRRLTDAEKLGPRTALTGEPLEPMLAVTAAAQSAGAIGHEHVRIIRHTMDNLPLWADPTTRQQAETDLVRAAVGLGPEELRKAANRLLALLDQDGAMPDDAERARRKGFWIGKQGADGMTPVRGNLDPQARATLDAVFAKLAGPGMCNPDDTTPCITGTPSQAQIDADTRSVGQRNHDALTTMARSVLSSGELGQHNGLPVSIIVTTTLQDLESAAGCAVTGGGTLLPMSDVIRMASHSHHYLSIFDKHTNVPLYLGRTKRIASPGQRLVLHARDRGCTHPGCPVPGYGCQVHHINGWAKNGGRTDIIEEVLACRAHNLLAEQGWTVRIRADGSVEWIPPPALDVGQARTNAYHHPERVLKPPDDDGDAGDDPDTDCKTGG